MKQSGKNWGLVQSLVTKTNLQIPDGTEKAASKALGLREEAGTCPGCIAQT